MWIFLTVFALALAFLAPKPKLPHKTAAGLSEVSVNTTSSDRNIAYLAGKDLYKGSNGFWYGDFSTTPITQKVKTGLFSSDQVVVGHKYNLGLALGLCYGDGVVLHQINFGDKIGWQGTLSGTGVEIVIDEPTLFGKVDEEGGVGGVVRFYEGTTAQSPDSYLTSQIDGGVPAWRRLSYLVFENFYWGNSPSLPMVNLIASRYPNPLGQTNHIIGEDANPSYMLYEILTQKFYSCGIDAVRFNTSSFITVGTTLFNEGFGLTFTFDQALTVDDAQEQILRHINGTVYTDLSNGLITLDLVRDDYDVMSLPVVNDEAIKQLSRHERGSIDSLSTELRVRYVDRDENYKKNIEIAINSAARFLVGAPSPQEITFYGIRNKSLANQVAWRDLRTVSSSLAQIEVHTDRTPYGLRRGSPFVLQSDLYSIPATVVRVQGCDYGDLKDGTLRLSVAEDQFALGQAVFGDTPPSGTVPLVQAPINVTLWVFEEVPLYYLQKLEINPMGVMMLVASPRGDHTSYDILSSKNAVNYDVDTNNQAFTTVGTLVGDISGASSSLQVDTSYLDPLNLTTDQIRANGGNIIVLYDGTNIEWAAYTGISVSGGVTTLTGLERGLMDRTPKDFLNGVTSVWQVTNYGLSGEAFTTSDTPSFKLPTSSLGGTLDPVSTVVIPKTLIERSTIPYPVRDLRINNISFPQGSIMGEDIVFTWKGNDNGVEVFPYQSEADITPPGTYSYSIRIYDRSDDSLMHSVTGLTSPTYTFLFIDEFPVYAFNCRVEVECIVDSVSATELFKVNYNRPSIVPPTNLNGSYAAPVAPTDLLAENV